MEPGRIVREKSDIGRIPDLALNTPWLHQTMQVRDFWRADAAGAGNARREMLRTFRSLAHPIRRIVHALVPCNRWRGLLILQVMGKCKASENKEKGMKMKMAVAAAALLGAVAITAPSTAAPLAGAGVATSAAKTDAKATEAVRYRRYYRRPYYRRHWRPYRPYRYYRPYGFYRPYYGYGPGWYGPGWGPGWGYRRPGIYLGFGW
jgi:hypothetical protein